MARGLADTFNESGQQRSAAGHYNARFQIVQDTELAQNIPDILQQFPDPGLNGRANISALDWFVGAVALNEDLFVAGMVRLQRGGVGTLDLLSQVQRQVQLFRDAPGEGIPYDLDLF